MPVLWGGVILGRAVELSSGASWILSVFMPGLCRDSGWEPQSFYLWKVPNWCDGPVGVSGEQGALKSIKMGRQTLGHLLDLEHDLPIQVSSIRGLSEEPDSGQSCVTLDRSTQHSASIYGDLLCHRHWGCRSQLMGLIFYQRVQK